MIRSRARRPRTCGPIRRCGDLAGGIVAAVLLAVSLLPVEGSLSPALAAADAAKPPRIALICTGSTTDGGWNQLAKQAVDAVGLTLKARVSVLQKVTADQAANEMRSDVQEGYALVIAHGFEFLNPATEVARSLTSTRIAVSDASVSRPGVVCLDFDLSEASYQIGILAAMISRTGHLGFIGGEPIPSVESCFRGFKAGAQSVRPGITVIEAITNWDQPETSKTQAEAFIRQGIDGVFQDVDAASRGVFEAVQEQGASSPVYVYGSCADQNANPICGAFTPASAVIRLDASFLAVARSAIAGTLKAGVRHEDLASGVCVTVVNPALRGTVVTPAMEAAIALAGSRLIAGKISIPAR